MQPKLHNFHSVVMFQIALGIEGIHLGVSSVRIKVLTEIRQQANIVSFHDDTSRDEDRPPYCLGVELDPLEQGHLVFGVFRQLRSRSRTNL
jgi:hypothetical protein